ncbi:MAG: hypothetical protein ACJ75J_12865 [Cytophagaceae bacterium]
MKKWLIMLGISGFLTAGFAQAGTIAQKPEKEKTKKVKDNGTVKEKKVKDDGSVKKKTTKADGSVKKEKKYEYN